MKNKKIKDNTSVDKRFDFEKFDDKTYRFEAEILHEEKANLKHLRRLWMFVMSNAKLIAIIYLTLYIMLSLLRPIAAILWGQYIDLLAVNEIGVAVPVLSAVILLLVYYLISFISDLLMKYIEGGETIEQLNIVQTNRFQEKMAYNIFKKINKVDYDYWEVPQINDIVDRNKDFLGSGVSRDVMHPSYAIVAKFVSIVSIGLTLYIFSPLLCLMLLLIPIPVFFNIFVHEKLRFKFIKDNWQLQRKANYYQDLLLKTTAKEVKSNGLHDFFYQKWLKEILEYRENERKLYKKSITLDIINSLVSNLVNVACCFIAIILMLLGQITVGALATVLSLIGTLVGDTTAFISSISKFMSKKNEARVFYQMMDLPESNADEDIERKIEDIKFKNVSYRYPLTEKYVLNDINLHLKKGEHIAIVGLNGSGKTTFISLLTGLLKASKGEILINDESNNSSYFSALSSVVQNPTRYTSITVGDNVYLGDTLNPRDEKRIEEALEFVGLDVSLKDQELGRDIGGIELSGGQWQKLAIARSYYRNKDIFILDEPTSNIDPIAENEIFKNYLEMAKGKTVVYVTHRISLATLAKRIIVFKDGEIVGDATHDELYASSEYYATLYNEQSKWYDR